MSGDDRWWIVMCALAAASYAKSSGFWGQLVCLGFWAILLGLVAILDSKRSKKRQGWRP